MTKKALKIKDMAAAEYEKFIGVWTPDELNLDEQRRLQSKRRELALAANDSLHNYEERHLSED